MPEHGCKTIDISRENCIVRYKGMVYGEKLSYWFNRTFPKHLFILIIVQLLLKLFSLHSKYRSRSEKVKKNYESELHGNVGGNTEQNVFINHQFTWILHKMSVTTALMFEINDFFAHVFQIFYFLGKRCEYLVTVQLVSDKSYITMDSLYTVATLNITLIIKTSQMSGVLLYTGDRQHLAVEMFKVMT